MKKNNLHNNKEGFKVPENYFDTFEERLFEKISKEDHEDFTLPKKISSGLKEPYNYFDTFETKLMEKLNTETQEPSVLSEKLKTGLTVPEKYFENLEDSILKQTIEKNNDTKVISIFSRANIIYFSGIAAMIAIIISITTFNQKETLSFDTVALSDIQKYFEEGNAELSDAEIAELFNGKIDLTETFYEDEISDEELENYLSNEELADEIIYIE
ncbi:hypothetical protein [Aquimarina sp. SS2-1]|uniref:hypothetical protein n=1 Tax=Aquimarina besae TaxID=3342247 RepID=UPI00366A9706